jgi:methylenetetrahydrofolate reductase (NADPH)
MARISDLLTKGPTSSFEFFPPKTDEAQRTLVQTLRDLEPLGPSFVSVTYGAGGTTRERTHDMIVGLLRTTMLNPMAHLTCAAHSRIELAEVIVRYARAGMRNLLALGGDPPVGQDLPEGELRHALELVHLARAIAPDLSIGVAAHPEGHPRSGSIANDRKHLAEKLAAADFAVTQFFFRVDDYLALVNDLADLGVDKPVIPGIMPVLNLASVSRMAEMSGTSVPAEVVAHLQRAEEQGGPEEVRNVGVALATELCTGLLAAGAPGLHFYTLNRSLATLEIHRQLFPQR